MDRPTRAFFVYFLSSYVLVLLIGTVAFAFVYAHTRAQIQTKTDDSIRLLLRRGQDLTEARLDEVTAGAYRITRTRDLTDFMRVARPLEPRHYYTLLRLRGEFEQFSVTSSFADSVYLVFRESGALLSSFYTSPDFEFVVRNFLRYEGRQFYEWSDWMDLWNDRVRLMPASQVHLHGRSVNALTLRIPLPFGAMEPRAVLIALIPVSAIDQHFQNLIDVGAAVSIVDHDGLLLYSSAPPATDDRRWTVTTSGGPSGWGLSYRVGLPKTYVRQQMFLAQMTLNAILVLTVLVGLAAAVFFALRNSRPLARLFSLIGRIDMGSSRAVTPDHAFVNVMERLAGREIDIKRAVERRDQMLTSGFYERLLRGGFSGEEEVEEHVSNLGLEFTNQQMRAVVVTCLSTGEVGPGSQAEALVDDYLRSRMPQGVHLYRTREGEVLLVPAVPESIRTVEAALTELGKATGIRIAAGVGAARASLTQLSESFAEAVRTLKTTLRDRGRHEVIYFQQEGEPYDLAEDDRRRLLSMTLAGDLDGLSELLGSVRDRNFLTRATSTSAREALFADLRVVVRQARDTLATEPASFRATFDRLAQYHSADDFFSRLAEVFACLASASARCNGHRSSVSPQAIAAYLDRRCADSQLSLTSVAEDFQINPQYMSRMFHEQMGESFSGYLERVRMSAARRAIEAGQTPLKAVAVESGFSSWNSFYKAFRRYYGVSPSAYREAFMRNGASVLPAPQSRTDPHTAQPHYVQSPERPRREPRKSRRHS